MESVEDDDTMEPRDWRAHPGAKLGAWSLELPLSELLGPRPDTEEAEDETQLVASLLASLRSPGT
jgi:hypothetical protein